MSRFGVVTRQVQACDYDAMEAAITPQTKLLVSESPTNPHLSIVDLERFATIGTRARRRDADRRHAGDAVQPPAARGGHRLRAALGHQVSWRPQRSAGRRADRLADKLEDVRKLRGIMGAINSPHNIHLLLRGLKTFELRMQRHNENGLAVARFLANHPRVERVYYPGLASHPHHEVAEADDARLWRPGDVSGEGRRLAADGRRGRRGEDSAHRSEPGRRRVADRAAAGDELLRDAARPTASGSGIPDNMIRLACGIENSEDLIADLKQALGAGSRHGSRCERERHADRNLK